MIAYQWVNLWNWVKYIYYNKKKEICMKANIATAGAYYLLILAGIYIFKK